MVSVLASSEEDRGCDSRSVQTKYYKLVHASVASQISTPFTRKAEDGFGRNEANVTVWSAMSINGLLFH